MTEKQNKSIEETEDMSLPSFMSEEEPEEQTHESIWNNLNLYTVITAISVFWIFLIIIYISKFYGWSNMLLLTPSELGLFLIGTTFPLAVICLVISYIDRGAGFKAEAKLLRAYMKQLVYPEEGMASTAKAMADAIREQVEELQNVTKMATEKTQEIKNELASKVDDFSKIMNILDEYSTKTINQLNLGVGALIENCNFATSQTKTMNDEFLNNAEKIKNKVADLTVSMNPILQDVRNTSMMLNELTNDNQKKITSANERFLEYTNMFGQLNENISKIENSIMAQKDAVEEQAKLLDKSSQYLDSKLGEYGKLISMEVEAMMNSSGQINNNLQEHVVSLKNTSKEISAIFNNIQSEIESKNKMLENSSKNNTKNILNSVKLLDEEIQKLEHFTSLTEKKNVELREIADSTADKLSNISDKIIANTDVLRTKAIETVDAFSDVAGSLKKNTKEILEISTDVSSKTKNSADNTDKQIKNITEINKQLEKTKKDLEDVMSAFAKSAAVTKKAIEAYEIKIANLTNSMQKIAKE